MILNSPYISGSLTVTGNIISSGSITISGSIASASYASNAERVDGLDSTSFVFTSSYNTDSASVSTRVTKIEGNYATTGSNVFMGAQTVCANITSTGTIIAQTLNVQQVTSSIVYSSGSNIFGCQLTDVQQMTGSVRITGSLNVAGAGCFASSIDAGSYIRNTNSTADAAVTIAADGVSHYVSATNAARTAYRNLLLNPYGCNVGIGTSSPSNLLTIDGVTNAPKISIERDTVGTNTIIGYLDFTNNNAGTTYGRVLGGRNTSGDGYVALGTGVSTNLYALESGNVGIGASDPVKTLDVRGTLAISNNASSYWYMDRDDSDGRFKILTDSNCEAFTITTTRNVGIGTCSPNAALTIQRCTNSGGGSTFPRLEVENILPTQGDGSSTFNFADVRIASGNSCVQMFLGTSYAAGTWEPQGLINVSTNTPLVIRTCNTERMRITSGGNVGIGCASPSVIIETSATSLPSFNATGVNPKFCITETNDNNSNAGIAIRKKHSTLHPANYWYGDIQFYGWDGTKYIQGALIEAVANGTPASDKMPGSLRFSTNGGSTGTTERMRITCLGEVLVNSIVTGVGFVNASKLGSYQEYTSDSNTTTLSTQRTAGLFVVSGGDNSNNQGSYTSLVANVQWGASNNPGSIFRGYQNGTLSVQICYNGNLTNTNGSYGTIASDVRLKENIVPATSKLCDLLRLNVVNFNLIGNKEKHIGFIAQEMQEVFPSFVFKSDTRDYDANGNLISGYEDTLGLKVGMEFAVLVKAIQEQQCTICTQALRINILESCLGLT